MSRHESAVRLLHMLEHSREALAMIQGKTRSDLDTNRTLNLALVRLLEIVGEAASRIPKEERQKYPDIDWPQIVGLQNRLIHGYDFVDFDLLWQITNDDLPSLIDQLEKIFHRK